MIHYCTTENLKRIKEQLHVGDTVYLSGKVYTSRDAAHKKMFQLIEQGHPLPYTIKDALIYYAGPTPAKEGQAIGSCGPTTSSRMDVYAPKLYDMSLLATIGKGMRDKSVIEAITRNKALYLCAVGGAGAIASNCITSAKEIAFFELGCESVKELIFKDFPLYVAIDTKGNSIFK